MQKKEIITALVGFGIWGLLAWQYFNGGIPSHHVLHDKTLPEISNLWGGLLLPVLTYWLLSLHEKHTEIPYDFRFKLIFVFAVITGVTVSVVFVNNITALLGLLGPLLLMSCVLLRVYRPAYILGFVLSMTFSFGAVLPTGVVAILALLSFALHQGFYPMVMKLVNLNRSAN